MPTWTFRQSVPLSGVANPMTGTQWEYLPFPAMIEIGMLTEGAAGSILATILSGPDTLAEEQPVQNVAAGIWPKYPDDFHWQDEAAMGDRFKINLRNTTGAAVIVNGVVKITPMTG